MATDQKSIISDYDTQIKQLKGTIGSSSSYLGNNVPSDTDISNQIALKSLQSKRQSAEDELLKTQWYGTPDPNAPVIPPKDSRLSRGLKLLSLPNYAQVGAIESMTGKGTVPGFFANIGSNINEQEGYGSLLTKFGAPKSVSAPVGFALDVATDPINWATMGTAATVPRLAVGLAKGELKGLAEGAASSVLARGAAWVAKKVPYLKDLKPVESLVSGVEKAGTSYNKIIGKDVMAELAARSAKFESGKLLGQKIKSSLAESPKALEWIKNKPKNIETVQGWLDAKPGPWIASKGKQAEAMQSWIDKTPEGAQEVINWKKGKPFAKRVADTFFSDSSPDWLKKSVAQDAAINKEVAAGTRVVGTENIAARTKELTNTGIFGQLDEASQKFKQLGEEGYKKWRANQIIDEGAFVATDYSKNAKFINPDDAGQALAGEFENDRLVNEALQINAKNVDEASDLSGIDISGELPSANPTVGEVTGATKKVIQGMARQKTGVGWYDDMARWFRGIKVGDVKVGGTMTGGKLVNGKMVGGTRVGGKDVGETIADSYNNYMGFFKTGKIGGNLVGSFLRAVVGNHTMGMLAGLNGWEKEYSANVFRSIKFINGAMSTENSSKFIRESFLNNPRWVETLSKDPTTFQSVFGVHPDFFNMNPANKIAEKILTDAKNAGMDTSKITLANLSNVIGDLKESGLEVNLKRTWAPRPKGMVETLAQRTAEPTTKTGFYVEELMGGAFQQTIKNVEKKAADGSPLYKLLHWYLTKPMDAYSTADGGFKLGYALKMTNTGITEKEITMLSKFYPTIGKNVEFDAAKNLYKVDPEQAMGAVQEIFMNYGTMPEAVKVLRSMPLFGAPFGSFMYGMTVKTAKAAVRYNPAMFSKINYFLKEFQGDKTPLERQQLAGPYYSWYNKDGMIKLPFFNDNPVFLNVADMIPYYTMNMLQSTERQSEDTNNVLPNTIVSIFDKLPFFQQPEGQVLLDYLIIPTILRESNPSGRFGQPLWKTDSSLLEKAGYAARSFAEAPLPTLVGLAGIPGGKVVPGITEYVPSFRYRQLANAVQGKSSMGISGQEDPFTRTSRTIMGTFGLPWYRMNLSYTPPKTSN